MYLPLWGLAIILALCLVSIWTAGTAFFDIIVLGDLGGVTKYFTLPVLAILIILSIWLGYDAIMFNSSQE